MAFGPVERFEPQAHRSEARSTQVRLLYRHEKQQQQIEIGRGLWCVLIVVSWNGRSQSEEYFFRFDGARTVPEIVADPRGSVSA